MAQFAAELVVLFARNNHSNFIKQYFKRSGKEIVLELIDINNKEILKAAHTNSIFFLGILIHKNTKLNNDYFTEFNNVGYKEFPFMWFLTCLFHDFAFQQENSEELIEKIFNIDTLYKFYNVRHKLLEEQVQGIFEPLFNHIPQYFLYRREKHKKIEHGILAGIYFYDRLVKNRIKKEQENNREFFWGKELEKQYGEIATAIASHNIWFPNDKTKCDYIKFEMEELMNLELISLNNFPLLFLLGLVDTIDPIKTYSNNFNVDYIFENILIDFESNKLILKNTINSKLDFNEIVKKSDNLIDWLDVKIEKDANTIEIKINQC